MKKIYTSLLVLLAFQLNAQVPVYYSGIDFTASPTAIHAQLSSLITNTHQQLTYTQCWDVLKESDLETGSNTHVLLVYGYNDMDGNASTDRTRLKDLNGGNNGDWNREHIFPKSLGNPDLGTDGPGADAHNLRSADVQQNGNRGNSLYTESSGNAGSVSGDWYPGDEFKGDCARIIMYMYLRYGNRCLPSAVGTGSVNSSDPNMMNMFLEWNADDPVSQFEIDRNNSIYEWQGNRNPFIDNPSIATAIWGGPIAEDPWGGLSVGNTESVELNIFPMPVKGGEFFISGINTLDVEAMQLYDTTGKLVLQFDPEELVNNGGVSISNVKDGTYILSIIFDEALIRKKIIIE